VPREFSGIKVPTSHNYLGAFNEGRFRRKAPIYSFGIIPFLGKEGEGNYFTFGIKVWGRRVQTPG